jgi:hypothetical protein
VGEPAQALVSRFQDFVDAFGAYVGGLSEAQWQTLVPNEGRTVGVVAHHVASAFVGAAQGAFMLSLGRSITVTTESIDQGNARHAEQNAAVTKQDVLALLRKNSTAAAAVIARLSDAQLEKSGTVVQYGGKTMTAGEFAERAMIGHLQDHWTTLRVTLDG